MPDDSAREALLRAIGAWAEARDLLSADVDRGTRPDAYRERLYRERDQAHVAMLEAIDALGRSARQRP